MKNLKRILALILCLAMVMGLAVSAGATSFTDDDEISEDNYTAVEVLTALGIINGYTDGSFQPTETVTRAEVCKMIAVAFNGGDESINDLYADVICGLTDIGGTWAEGYIKYCYATGIVDGYPDGTFLPDGEITGLELCQIMLNILNYEVTWDSDTPWATAIMAKSSLVGLLANVSTPVGSAITRQEAAQVIFNALTLPIQGYNALGVRVDSDDTILSLYLDGEVETIVITANEYASLTDDEPADAGTIETEDGDVYDWDTEAIEQSLYTIGLSYDVWVIDGESIVYAEDSGYNTVEEYTSTGKPLAKRSDLDLDDAEYFVNFEETAYTIYVADAKISYTVKTTKANLTAWGITSGYEDADEEDEDGVALYIYEDTITVDDELTADDLLPLKYIFKNADKESILGYSVGEVYVGTQSLVDVSDYDTWSEFLDEYFDEDEDGNTFANDENGNYVAIIDNDADGDAEYVLKIAYTLAVVEDIASNGTYTLSTIDTDGDNITVDNDGNPIVMTDDNDLPEEDDVIVYAAIDGVYYTNLAEVVTVVAEDISYSASTLTTDDDVDYAQSGIDPEDGGVLDDDELDGPASQDEFDDYFEDNDILFYIDEATEGFAYDLYLDNYGYIRALTLSDADTGYGLLVDAYYAYDARSEETYMVEMYTDDGESDDYEVLEDMSSDDFLDWFIDTNSSLGDETWGRLLSVKAGDSDFLTNVAWYYGSTDALGIYYPETYIDDSIVEIVKSASGTTVSSKYYTLDAAGQVSTGGDYVYADSDTIYYYVGVGENSKDAMDVLEVETWTGRTNYPSNYNISSANIYLVAHEESSGSWVADVIVIEYEMVNSEALFAYEYYTQTSSYYTLYGLVVDDGDVATDSMSKVSTSAVPAFYDIEDRTKITEDFANYNIYAGIVQTVADDEIYLSISTDPNYDKGTNVFDGDETVYCLKNNASTSSKSKLTVSTLDVDDDEVKSGDLLIYVTDGTEPVYAIDVTQSTKGEIAAIFKLIMEEAVNDGVIESFTVPATGTDGGKYTLTYTSDGYYQGTTTTTSIGYTDVGTSINHFTLTTVEEDTNIDLTLSYTIYFTKDDVDFSFACTSTELKLGVYDDSSASYTYTDAEVWGAVCTVTLSNGEVAAISIDYSSNGGDTYTFTATSSGWSAVVTSGSGTSDDPYTSVNLDGADVTITASYSITTDSTTAYYTEDVVNYEVIISGTTYNVTVTDKGYTGVGTLAN